MAFWTDIFTLETWSQAERHDWHGDGLSGADRQTKGGYSERMFARVHPGDVLPVLLQGPGDALGGRAAT